MTAKPQQKQESGRARKLKKEMADMTRKMKKKEQERRNGRRRRRQHVNRPGRKQQARFGNKRKTTRPQQNGVAHEDPEDRIYPRNRDKEGKGSFLRALERLNHKGGDNGTER
ncbi:unnamed protein product, partial [Oikopleura dioica]